MLRRAYGNEAMCRVTCFEWHAHFKRGRTSLEDNERSERPSTSSTPKNVETIRWLVHEDRQRTIKEIAQFYCSVLHRLREDIWRKRPELWRAGNWLLHDDNIPSHQALATRVSRPQQHYHISASTLLSRFGPLRLLPVPEDDVATKGSPI